MVCRIAIIGDSSSSGIGLGQCIYPAKLYQLLQKKLSVQILNCSTPGLTSADASRFYHSELANQSLDFLIIYLGNNEGAVSVVPKGYYSPFKTRWIEYFTGQRKNKQFGPIFSPPRFEFNYQIPPQTIATTPKEFNDNLQSIIGWAIRQQVKVIILNPIANPQFPCGVGAVNSTYFCNLDKIDQLYDIPDNKPIDEPSAALHAGLQYFIEGNNDKACSLWKPLVSIDNVAGFIARHNLACAQVGIGDNTAESQLRALLGIFDIYDSTIYYNLAQLKNRQGDIQSADNLLQLAIEKDTSSYRIQQKYRDIIAGLPRKNEVRLLDLKSILEPTHFIDYCHPTADGHNKIACALAELILTDAPKGSHTKSSSYQVMLPSPNYLIDPGQTLLDYYSIDWPIDQNRIVRAFTMLKPIGDCTNIQDQELALCVENFFQSNSRHPIFTNNIILTGTWMPRSHEILTFPEYFIHRILYNYTLEFENATLIKPSNAAKLEQVRFTAADYKKMILRTSSENLDMDLDVRPEYYAELLNKVKEQLIGSNQMYRVMINERICTIKTWYTREAFRYGTQSRLSMLYARWDIEIIVESLIAAIVIASKLNNVRVIDNLSSLLSLVLDLVLVHEQQLQLYHQNRKLFSFDRYQTALEKARHSIKSFIDISKDSLLVVT